MFLIALIKTLVVGILDSFYSAFIKGNINDIPYEETANKIRNMYKAITYVVIVLVFTLFLYTMDALIDKLDRKNAIIDKQVAIIRECRPDHEVEKIPINK